MPKILIIRFSSIGDIVLTSPVIRCLKNQFKDSEIHFLTKKSFSPILENNPYLSKIFYLDQNETELISELKKEKYDLLVDLHHNIRSVYFSKKIGSKTVRFKKLNILKWVYVNLKINRLPQVHIVDRYMNTIKKLGIKNDDKGLDYFIQPHDENCVENLPDSFKKGYVVIVLGATYFTKSIPEKLVKSLIEKINLPIILLGGPDDKLKGERIFTKCNNYTLIQGAGKYTLNESAAIIKHADLVITSDTGLMHIAAAFRKKIISIWGNTVPEFGMTPYFPSAVKSQSVIIENKEISCRPCSKLGYNSCPKKHFKCMNDLDPDVILKESSELLNH